MKRGERIEDGSIMRTAEGGGAVVALADGSRVEMRAQSELTLNADVPKAPSVFDALEKQLGLKLERDKGSREYIVIDHIERPSPN